MLACQKAIDSGKDVRYLVTVRPKNSESYMFHSANLDAVPVIARLSGMEYVEITTEGKKEAELADLEDGLAGLDVEGVTAGAIASVYQADRVKAITDRLGILLFTPLWHQDTEVLLREVAERMDAILVVTAAEGLDKSFLGAHINAELIGRLKRVSAQHHINLVGEGGEYESLTLDAPFYSRPLTYTTSEIRVESGRSELILGGFA
jgi:ABC transporter with metal-binding/Fe-S-binding domain ATP-binding protein